MDNSPPPLSDEARQRAREERKARRRAERQAQQPQAPATSPWTSAAPSPRPAQSTISRSTISQGTISQSTIRTPTPAATLDGGGPQRRQQPQSSDGFNPIVKKVGRIAGNMLLKQLIRLVLGRFMR